MGKSVAMKVLFVHCAILLSYLSLTGQNYERYHEQVLEIEKYIAREKYDHALQGYQNLFDSYEFVFLRDYIVASQIALKVGQIGFCKVYMKEAIIRGWDIKHIKRNKFIRNNLPDEDWEEINQEYPELTYFFLTNLNYDLRKKVYKLYTKDQKMAIRAALRLNQKMIRRFCEKKYIPHSEKTVHELIEIIKTNGYPGEKVIGNSWWGSTILSHHNSIFPEYNLNDPLYEQINNLLFDAFKKGEISPYEMVLIDDWYRNVAFDCKESTYGIISCENNDEASNELREKFYYRSIELQLILEEIEEKTGMQLELGETWY